MINEVILHLLVPLAFIRIIAMFYELDLKLILLLSTYSLVPDIDFFVFWHRATFHNLFFGALIVIIAVLLLKKYFSKTKIALVGSFFFLSHIVLDNFYVDWFYPFEKTHFNPFTGATLSLKAMNDARPHFSQEYILVGIFAFLLTYLLLTYEAFFRKNVKTDKR